MTIGRNTPLPVVPEAVIIQWANGKPVSRIAGGRDKFTSLVGFHVEVGKDAALDVVLEREQFSQIEIKHQRPGGAEIVRHWWLGESIRFLPITAGPVASTVAASLANGNAQATADAGIGLRWPRGEGERSRMAVRGYVRELWEAGYDGLAQLGVRSRMTDVLLGALLDHTRAVEACDSIVDRAQHPDLVSPAELWLPLEAGEEAEFGRADTATVAPFRSGHPAVITAEYLRTAWRDKEIYAAACGAWPLVKVWALSFARGEQGDAVEGEA